MTMLVNYNSKKAARAAIGSPLDYTETSVFGPQFRADGVLTVAYRPAIQGLGGREWFGQVTMRDGLIVGVK
jgi:hypothetical protein